MIQDNKTGVVDIVIPVYRGLTAVRQCIASVLEAVNQTPVEIIIVNDASPEPAVSAWLADLDDPRITLLVNHENQGFVGSVNRAAAEHPDRHFIILNADTEVAGNWVDRMVACAAANPKAATITPFSNNGSIASYPLIDADNPLPADWSIARLDQLCAEVNAGQSAVVPVGVGFCMYVARPAWAACGGFDTAFGRGYGEEVDFCMAATAKGWHHRVATDVFVFHEGSVSFGRDEAPVLQASAQKIIDDRYPDFPDLVAAFYEADPLSDARVRLLAAQISQDPAPRVLMVSHSWGGGVHKHVQELAAGLRAAGQANTFVLYPSPGLAGAEASLVWLNQTETVIARGELPESRSAWADLLQALGFCRLHFHHVAHWPAWVLDLPVELNLPYDVTLHDFWPVCPQFHFTDADGNYCGRPDAAGCRRCLAERPDPWGWGIDQWRERLQLWLTAADRVIGPSQSAADTVHEYFPELDILVQPHLDAVPAEFSRLPSRSLLRRKIALLGSLSNAKGLQWVEQVISLAAAQDATIDFLIVGATERPLDIPDHAPVKVLGSYEESTLVNVLLRERVDGFWFASIVPETYGYALSVALATGLPIAALATGAQAERLADYPAAVLIPREASAAEVLQQLLDMPAIYRVEAPVAAGPSLGVNDSFYPQAYAAPLATHASTPVPAPRLAAALGALPDAIPPKTVERMPIEQLLELALDCGQASALLHLRQRCVAEERQFIKLLEQRERDAAELRHHKDVIQKLKKAHERHVGELEARIREQLEVLDQRDVELQQVSKYARRLANQFDRLERGLKPLRPVIRAGRRVIGAVLRRAKLLRRLLVFARYHYAIGGWRGLLASARRRGFAVFRQRLMQSSRSVQGAAAAGLELEQPSGPVALATSPDPVLSIVIPSFGEHNVTRHCLASIAAHPPAIPYEVLVADDAFVTPFDPETLDISGVRVLRQPENLGFLRNVNAAVTNTNGAYILLLNNDTRVHEAAIDTLYQTFEHYPDAGAVGAKLLDGEGRLQEAGGIVWRDASAWNWGKGADPEDPRFNYVRDADYCSAAALMVARSAWDAVGGFDDRFVPAYYEDTDLCFALRAAGRRVIYQPAAVVTHWEGVSHGTSTAEGIKRHQALNQSVFCEKWTEQLALHEENGRYPEIERDRGARHRILWVEACMLTPDQDSGSLRTWHIMEILLRMGAKVTFVAANLQRLEPYASRLQQLGVEVLYVPQVRSVVDYIQAQGAQYDVITLCRHYIAIHYCELIRRHCPDTCIWFDTIDLHYLRLRRQFALDQLESTRAMAELAHREEMAVIAAADVTLVVSDVEVRELAREAPEARVEVLSNIHRTHEGGLPFTERRGVIFVGGFQHPPNIDAVEYYAREIWPLLREQHPELETYVIGSKMPDRLRDMGQAAGLQMLGFVEDLAPYYQQCVVAIAPLRYGAGVKGKVNQALSYGVPVVGSSMAFEGMSLAHGRDAMMADTPDAFADAISQLLSDSGLWQTLSDNGRASLDGQFSFDVAEAKLRSLFLPTTERRST